MPQKFDQVVQSWDTANKPSELSDYSVCATWGVRQRRIYLLHVLCQRRLKVDPLSQEIWSEPLELDRV